MSQEDLDNTKYLSFSNKANKINEMCITLAFLVMKKLQAELCFYNCKEFASTF